MSGLATTTACTRVSGPIIGHMQVSGPSSSAGYCALYGNGHATRNVRAKMRSSKPHLQYLHDLLDWLHLRRERSVEQVVVHLVQARRQVLQEPAARRVLHEFEVVSTQGIRRNTS